MDKVKLTQLQADEIAYHLQLHTNLEILRMWRGVVKSKWSNGDPLELKIDEETLIKALYIGYEIEQTPEERIQAIFRKHEGGLENTLAWEFQQDIIEILNAVNFKVEGVND